METADPRLLSEGLVIPTGGGYADQPYIVRTADGAWLCSVTTGAGHEGASGQHIVTTRSTDRGRTWSPPVAVEPPDGPEASYCVMLAVPSGRVYIFYNHNTDNVRRLEYEENGEVRVHTRVDSLGRFVFKYSDDGGRSWSARRYDIPVREFRCDRENYHGGRLRYFWNVGRPFVHGGAAYVPLIKVGRMGPGFFAQSEGTLLRSAGILDEPDPAKIRWETLPEGDTGLRAPPGGGPVSEEQSYTVLSDGSFAAVYRSIAGSPVETYSRDGGRSWTPPRYLRFADGRPVKHPRAANFLWRCGNGKFLYWFHNHGGRFIGEHPNAPNMAYEDRNPVWLCGGVEADGPDGRHIRWSEPEIVLYDDDPFIRISYPDFVEDGGYFLTETEKQTARLHEIPAGLLEGTWRTLEDGPCGRPPAEGEEIFRWTEGDPAETSPGPRLPAFVVRDAASFRMGGASTRAGFSVEMLLTPSDLGPGRPILDTMEWTGKGMRISTADDGAVELFMTDGQTEARWRSDPVLRPGVRCHVVAVVDGGPRIVSFVADGRFCDGGDRRQFGWGRFSPHLKSADGGNLRVFPGSAGRIERVAVFPRALRTAECVLRARAAGVTPPPAAASD